MKDPVTTLILGGAVIFLAAAVLAALVARSTFRFERKRLNLHWDVLRNREQLVTSREYQVDEMEQELIQWVADREQQLAQKARDRNLKLGQRAHDAHSMVQATLAQIDDDTVVNVLDWEEL